MVAHGCDINVRCYPNGRSILHEACLQGKPDWVKALVENGGLPHMKCSQGKTAVEMAKEPFPGKSIEVIESIDKILYNFALKTIQ